MHTQHNSLKENTFARGWYAILPASELRQRSKPLALLRFGLPLVLWRANDHQVQIFLDRCPHRRAKLSLGKIVNDTIECPFHGFRFGMTGTCVYAPEFEKAIPGLALHSFSAYEFCGMIWMYWGETPTTFLYPDVEALHQSFVGCYSHIDKIWRSHITYCIENQLDYTHLRFVHHNTIGRGFKMPAHPHETFLPTGIDIALKDPETISIQYFFPNVWLLHISKRMKLMLFFAPINEKETQLYLRVYRKFLTNPMIKTLVDSVMVLSNRVILKQDQKVVASQGLLPSYDANDDVLMRYDKAIRYFRESWQARCLLP